MSEVLDYILLLIAAATVITVGEEAAPKRARPVISFCLGVYLLYIIVSPLPALVGGISGALGDYSGAGGDGAGGEIYYETATEAAEAGLASAISERFGIDKENISVRILELDIKDFTAGRIFVTLTGGGALSDTRAIEEYAEEIFGGDKGGAECTVEIRLR